MKKTAITFVTFILVAFSFNAGAADKKETALNLVKAAIEHYKNVGQEAAYADFSTRGSDYNFGEFYIFINDMASGKTIYHGVNPKLMGRDLTGLKDTDGKPFVKELLDNSRANGNTWTDYKWVHPETKKIAPKTVYSEVHDGKIFSTGYYK